MASRRLVAVFSLLLFLFLPAFLFELQSKTLSTGEFPEQDPLSRYSNLQPHLKQGLGCWIGFSAIDLTANTLQECYIIINPESTDGYDVQYDAAFVPGEGPVFYTESNGARLSTNSIPELSTHTQIKFIFSPNTNGAHRIEVFGLELIQDQVYLYDQLSKSDYNLTQHPVYEFQASVGEDSSRFMLHFQPEAISVQPDKQNRMFVAQGQFVLTNAESGGMVSFYSPGGICVKEYRVIPEGEFRQLLDLPSGIYITKYRHSQGTVVRKIIIP
jgi:hypothetical protein